MTPKLIRLAILEHRRAACDYRFVWRVAPAHQTSGWRRAALTHESLIRLYMREAPSDLPGLGSASAQAGQESEGVKRDE